MYRLASSIFSVGLMLVATALPSLVIGLIAGVFVDRWDRKRIMVGADLLRAALVALIPVLVPHGSTWLYAIVLLNSAITQSMCCTGPKLHPPELLGVVATT